MPAKKFSRRRQLTTLAAVTSLSLLVAACGSNKSSKASDVTATNAAATAGAAASSASSGGSGASGRTAQSASSGSNDGTVTWEWSLPTSLDPVLSTAGTDVHVLALFYGAITSLDTKGNAQPGLASSWKYNADGTAVSFTLRPNLKFSDGTVLDAAAVKSSLERGRDLPKSTIASQLAEISDITVESPTSFTLHLSQPDYQIPELLAGKDGMIVSPAAVAKNPNGIATAPVGDGPFTLASYVPDSHVNTVRNPGYWDAADIHLAKLNVTQITDPQQILAALQSGQVNVALLPGTLIKSAKAAGFTINAIPSLTVNEIDVQSTSAPMNNPKVIEAINDAIDRDAIVATQTFGYGTPAYQPFPQGYVGYNPSLATLYPYDVAKAKRLLTDAGYPNGISITISAASYSDPLAEQIQSQLKQAGINATIKNIPLDQFTSDVYVNKTVQFAIDSTAGRESPLQMLDVLYDQTGLMNLGGKTSTEPPTVAAALNAVRGVSLTDPKYPAILQKAVATAVTTEAAHIYLYYYPRVLATSSKVTGLPFDLVQQRFEGVRVAN
jgi:ABC-type transport system substrate-binding protein